MRDYGETLDLSKRKEEESCFSDGGRSGQQATTLPLIATHINTSRVLEGQYIRIDQVHCGEMKSA